MSETPSILLSGATGMIGRLLMEALSDQGVAFRAMVRTPEGLPAREGVVPVVGDFDDHDSVERALAGVERAFLLTNSSERAEAQQKAFVAAARRAGVRHVVKLSQLAADPDSPVRFLRYHAEVEAALRESGMDWTFVRPNLILHAYLPFGSQTKRGLLPAPIGDARVSVVDARDVAAVAAAALTEDGHAGATYTVTGPEAVSHRDIAAVLSRTSGHEIRFETLPSAAFAGALKAMGMPSWQLDGLIEDYAHYDRGEAAMVSPDVERVVGRPPRSVEAFARDHAGAF